jgi:hypothetical protein
MVLVWPSIVEWAHSAIISFPHRAWRALWLSISANGTTVLGLVATLLTSSALLIRVGLRRGWSGIKGHWSRHLQTGFNVLVVWWLIVFLYQTIFMPPEDFSAEEIERFAQGIVVVIASTDTASVPVGTGFWADDKGYAFTYGDPKESDTNRSIVRIGMVMTPPLLTGKLLTVITGVMYASGQLVYHDPDTGIKIVRVYNNPFSRKFHGFAEAEDTKSHEMERTIERYWVPQLSAQANVNVGDHLFLTGIEPGDKENLAMSTIEGQVIRLGADTSSQKRFLRIYTSLPFKPSYCGAPVLNTTKSIVGMIACMPGSTSVVIPSQYLSAALLEAKPQMTAFEP